MINKALYVNGTITSENVDELNQHFSKNEYEYSHIIFWHITYETNENLKINIPMSVKTVIYLSINDFNEKECSFEKECLDCLLKIPFGCQFYVKNHNEVNKILGKNTCYYKLDDILDGYKPSKYKITNFGKKRKNTRRVNDDYYLVVV
jgi:hypothetical protein